MSLLEKKYKALDFFKLSKEYLYGSKESLKVGLARLAVYTGYHSLELSLRGLLILKKERLPRSSIGILNSFWKLYPEAKKLPKTSMRNLYWAFNKSKEATGRFDVEIKRKDGINVIKIASFLQKSLGEKIKVFEGQQ